MAGDPFGGPIRGLDALYAGYLANVVAINTAGMLPQKYGVPVVLPAQDSAWSTEPGEFWRYDYVLQGRFGNVRIYKLTAADLVVLVPHMDPVTGTTRRADWLDYSILGAN